MAIVQPGAGVPTGGSLGGTTYSRNRYGSYTRNRTVPVNPNSPLQARARAIFQTAVTAWQTMTGIQRTAWNNWAAATPWLNKAGETVHLTGQVAFMRHYTAQCAGYFPAAADVAFYVPPVENDVGSISCTIVGDAITYSAATGAIQFDISAPAGPNNSWAETGANLLVEMTPGQNLTRNYHGSRWAGLFGFGVATSTWTWAADEVAVAASANPVGHIYHFPYGLAVGQQVWVRVRGLSLASDRRVTTQQVLGPYTLEAPA